MPDHTDEPMPTPEVTVPHPDRGPADALQQAVIELERHVSRGGWDGPVRLYALVRTADALAARPELADQLPVDVVATARRDPQHLFSVEQEGVPEADGIESLLAQIAWPAEVDGAAIVLERIVVPPAAESALPTDPTAALEALRNHPDRQDVRIAAAVLRDGRKACAVRTRLHDADDAVGIGEDVVPGLTTALAATLAG